MSGVCAQTRPPSTRPKRAGCARRWPRSASPARWRTSSTAAAAAGFDGIEIFEPDLVVSALSPAEIRARCADLGLSIDLYQPFRDLDSTDPERYAAQPPPRRAQVRAHGRAGHGPHPGLLRGGPGRRRRPRPPRRPAARRRRTGRGERDAHRLRGARLGHPDLHLRAVLGRRATGRPPRARPVPGQLPHPVPRLGSRGHRGHPRREAVLPPARRRPAHEHGRAAVEPPLPALPRPGRVGPARLPRPRAGRGLHGAAVARGVQRRLPPVRPAPRRRGRPPFTAGAAGGDRAACGCRRASAAHPGAARVRVHRDRRRRHLRGGRRRSCSTRSASCTPVSTAASRCSCGSRAKPAWCSTSRAATARRSSRSASRPPTRRAAAGRATALLAPPLPQHHGPAEADLLGVSAPDGTAVFFCHTATEGVSWLADFLPTGRRARHGVGHPRRPRGADPALRQLRRGRALLPLRCSACSPSTRPRSPPRSAWCATGPSATAA